MMDGEVNWRLRIGLIAALVVLLAAAAYLRLRRARITGETPEERIASISKVAHDRRIGAAGALAKVAREDPVAKVRLVAVAKLAGFADDDDVLPDVLAVSEDRSERVRAAAAGTLAAFEADAAADRLAAMMTEDASDEVRAAAATTLGKSNSPKAVIPLIQQAEGGLDWDTRIRAARALADRYGLVGSELDPQTNPAVWYNFIERVKNIAGVEEAFKRYSVPLEHHPEHLIKPPEEH